MAVGGAGVVRLWDHSTQTPLPSVTPHKSFIRQVEFSSDGKFLAISGTGTDVELWDPVGNELVASLPTPERVSSLAFAPTSDLLAIGQPGAINLWKVVEPEVRSQASGFESIPSSIAFSPEGCLALAFRGEAPARLWHQARFPCTTQILDDLLPSSLAYDNQGRLVTLADNQLQWYDQPAHHAVPTSQIDLEPGPSRSFQFLTASSDGKSFILNRGGQAYLWTHHQPDSLLPIDLRNDPPSPPGQGPGPGPGSGPRSRGPSRNRPAPLFNLVVGPDAHRLYLSSWTGQLMALAIDQSDQKATQLPWSSPIREVTALALTHDGATLAAGNREGSIALLDTATGQLKTWLDVPDRAENDSVISALAYSPDARSLAVGFRSGTVLLWNLLDPSQPTATLTLPSHRGAVLGLAFDPTGRHLATTGEDKTLTVWHLDTLTSELANLKLY